MSNTNNNDNSAVMAIGAVAAWLYCLAMAFFAILVFGALVLTLLAIYGQYRPLILNGQHITSEECERFIDRGVLGGFLLAAFVYFCQLMFDLEIDWNHYYLHIWIFGYPIVITRDLEHAREWLREHARGTERLGLIASSGAMRLRPEGISVKAKVDPANWFLNGKEDVRSSYYLEETATEFDIQGLELDWAGVCWDANLRMEAGKWAHYDFKGTKWQHINNDARKIYLANAYRVLLTRARQGMVIFVPKGENKDHTRQKSFYDGTYDFLKACGLKEI